MSKTKIEWCDMTVNPVVGCTYGCEYCYARKMNQRFGWVEDFNRPNIFPERLKMLHTKHSDPKIIFINSMSDIADWLGFMPTVKGHMDSWNTYLALTKRPEEINMWTWTFKPENMHIGQTITNQQGANNIHEEVEFLSIEPLLGPIRLDLADTNVGWVIIGAETGNRKGKVIPEWKWVAHIANDCFEQGIPVFMKSSLNKVMESHLLTEWPDFILKRHPEKGQK